MTSKLKEIEVWACRNVAGPPFVHVSKKKPIKRGHGHMTHFNVEHPFFIVPAQSFEELFGGYVRKGGCIRLTVGIEFN